MTIHKIISNNQELYSKDLDLFILGEGDKIAAKSNKPMTFQEVSLLNSNGYEKATRKLIKPSFLEKIFKVLGSIFKPCKNKGIQLEKERKEMLTKLQNTIVAENELSESYDLASNKTLALSKDHIISYIKGMSMDDIWGTKK
jgi:hypothetical protein